MRWSRPQLSLYAAHPEFSPCQQDMLYYDHAAVKKKRQHANTINIVVPAPGRSLATLWQVGFKHVNPSCVPETIFALLVIQLAGLTLKAIYAWRAHSEFWVKAVTAKFPPDQGSQFSATVSVKLLCGRDTATCPSDWSGTPPTFRLSLQQYVPRYVTPQAAAFGRCLPGTHLRPYWSVASLPAFSQNCLARTWPDSMAGSPASTAAAWKICSVDVSWASHWLPAITLLAGYKVTVVRVTRMCLWWHWHKLPIVSCQEKKNASKWRPMTNKLDPILCPFTCRERFECHWILCLWLSPSPKWAKPGSWLHS